jgi:farnesyl-diphosphate farnesyltransferase
MSGQGGPIPEGGGPLSPPSAPRPDGFPEPELLGPVLRDVSRAFYLTLRVLPPGLREPIGLAYLLARAADTLADSEALPPQERLQHLLEFRAQVEGPSCARAVERLAAAAARGRTSRGEGALLARLPRVFRGLEELAPEDRREVRQVVVTLTRGMQMDLERFPGPEEMRALETAADLDRYTYYVAGCVGEFWTRITAAHSPELAGWDLEGMAGLGVRFGKALQLTNILRDLPRDLRMGRCYLPARELAEAGLSPRDLLDPASAPAAGPVFWRWMEVALEHYRAAQEYVLAIPRRCLRLRLAALWPVLIGLATLGRLRRVENFLRPGPPVKVSRRWIYMMLVLSVPAALSDTLLRLAFARLRSRAEPGPVPPGAAGRHG